MWLFLAFMDNICYYIPVKGSDVMKREEMYDSLFEQFGKSAQRLCADSEGIYCEVSKEYKGAEELQKQKGFVAKIYYSSCYVKLIYTAHGSLGLVNSALGCSVCLDKNGSSREIPLPLMSDYLDYSITAPMFFQNLTDEKGLEKAFDCIGKTVIALLPELIRAGGDEEYKNSILNSYTEEMKYIFGTDDLENIIDYYFYDFFVLRFTTDVFDFYLKGNYEKVCKKLGKVKKLTGYEKRLLEALRSGMYEKCETSLQDISELCGTPAKKDEIKELLVLFASWFLLTPLTSAVYLLIFFAVFLMESKSSVCLLGVEYNWIYCITLGFFTAIGVSYFTRFKFYKLFNKKGYESYVKLSSMQNGKGADRFMKALTYIIFCVCVLMSVLLCKWNINFTESGVIDNTKFLSMRGEYFTYEEIERVYYLPERTNDFGDVLDFPSYVMVVGGKEIDFYDFADIADYEQVLLALLESKGVKVEEKG